MADGSSPAARAPAAHAASRGSPARRARLRRGVLASMAGLVLALLLAEAFARIRYGAPCAERLPIVRVEANRYRGWQMVPGELHYTYQHPVRINSLGLRGPELRPKVENERRVLALGDSLIYGQGVADDQTLPAHLERILNERDAGGRSWTVVNAGHRAYDTRQELGLLEELGSRIAPDVVVIFWYANDVSERDIERTYANLSASGPIAFDTGHAMGGWTTLKWHLVQLVRRSALAMVVHDLRKSGAPLPQETIDAALVSLDGYLQRFQELAARERFELFFTVVPDANGLVAPNQTDAISAAALGVARERGVRTFELRPALETLYQERGELPVLPYDGHYDGEGNRALAAAAADALLAPAPLSETSGGE